VALYLQKLALTSPSSGCRRSIAMVRSRTQAKECSFSQLLDDAEQLLVGMWKEAIRAQRKSLS
jgi:hypothetical protein